MEQNIFAQRIAQELSLQQHYVDNTLQLLNDGATIPFISRYRKERTGGLDEVQIAQISELNEKLTTIQKRKRRTKAQIAREQGLEPLSEVIMLQRERNPQEIAKRFVKGDVENIDMA